VGRGGEGQPIWGMAGGPLNDLADYIQSISQSAQGLLSGLRLKRLHGGQKPRGGQRDHAIIRGGDQQRGGGTALGGDLNGSVNDE